MPWSWDGSAVSTCCCAHVAVGSGAATLTCLPALRPLPCSECWRAPAAVMVREVSPPGLGSTASAMHLCIRNLVGGLGPIAVALLSAKVRRSLLHAWCSLASSCPCCTALTSLPRPGLGP
jgi:hypothetical protein